MDNTQQLAQERRERCQAAIEEVMPAVGNIPAQPAMSSERVYRYACIRLGVDVADLTLDNNDLSTAFRDRFRAWNRGEVKATRAAQMSEDEDVRQSVKAMAEWDDARAIIEAVTGEPVDVGDGLEPPPSAEQMYYDAALKMGAEIPADTDPAAYKFIFQAIAKNGGARRGDGVASMAADSAALAGFASRFPAARPRRLF